MIFFVAFQNLLLYTEEDVSKRSRKKSIIYFKKCDFASIKKTFSKKVKKKLTKAQRIWYITNATKKKESLEAEMIFEN